MLVGPNRPGLRRASDELACSKAPVWWTFRRPCAAAIGAAELGETKHLVQRSPDVPVCSGAAGQADCLFTAALP